MFCPSYIFTHFVFSTYVEMIPSLKPVVKPPFSVLHVCGDDPWKKFKTWKLLECSPRMWRWSSDVEQCPRYLNVFSTYVEMILDYEKEIQKYYRVLHVCGDDPQELQNFRNQYKCSPRMWRWSCSVFLYVIPFAVFSTYVEMILTAQKLIIIKQCVLHVCGDDPTTGFLMNLFNTCSPRMWRWSLGYFFAEAHSNVFSTYVEMILALMQTKKLLPSVLHVCGDDPTLYWVWPYLIACSPRMWRWSSSVPSGL